MASNRSGSWLRRLMQLPVAALGSSDTPAISLKTLDDIGIFTLATADCPLAAPLLQLLLPPQHPSLVPFRLGLGNHSLLLIQDREAGVRQNVVGIDIRDLLGNFNGFVGAVEVLQRPAQSMQRIGKLRISHHRLPVLL